MEIVLKKEEKKTKLTGFFFVTDIWSDCKKKRMSSGLPANVICWFNDVDDDKTDFKINSTTIEKFLIDEKIRTMKFHKVGRFKKQHKIKKKLN
jgi:hypothetical protein